MKLQENEIYWLAGILEGEAYFHTQTSKRPTGIAVEMTDEDIIKRICDITGNSYCKTKRREEQHKQAYKTSVRGKSAIELMKLVYPIMGDRRKKKIEECLDSFVELQRGKISAVQKEEISKLYKSGKKPKEIALQYGITHWRVYQLVR
jgi:hypothetical protein